MMKGNEASFCVGYAKKFSSTEHHGQHASTKSRKNQVCGASQKPTSVQFKSLFSPVIVSQSIMDGFTKKFDFDRKIHSQHINSILSLKLSKLEKIDKFDRY